MAIILQRGDILGTDISTSEIQDNSVTGAKIAMGSDAAGDVLYYNGTDYVRLGIGTAGQALVTNSGATAPEWGTGGATQILASGTHTSSGTGVNVIADISLAGDIGDDMILIDMWYIRSSGSGTNNDVGLNNSSSDTDAVWGNNNNSATAGYLRFAMVQNADDNTNVDGEEVFNGTSSLISNSTEFNLAAAEHIYLVCRTQDAGTILKTQYIVRRVTN